MTIASEGGTNKVVDGSISIVFLKDPTDPRVANDPAMKLYRSPQALRVRRESRTTCTTSTAWPRPTRPSSRLKAAGKNLTRAGPRQGDGQHQHDGNPFMMPGILIKTGKGDHFPIEQMLLQRWHKGAWKSFGGLWGYRGA